MQKNSFGAEKENVSATVFFCSFFCFNVVSKKRYSGWENSKTLDCKYYIDPLGWFTITAVVITIFARGVCTSVLTSVRLSVQNCSKQNRSSLPAGTVGAGRVDHWWHLSFCCSQTCHFRRKKKSKNGSWYNESMRTRISENDREKDFWEQKRCSNLFWILQICNWDSSLRELFACLIYLGYIKTLFLLQWLERNMLCLIWFFQLKFLHTRILI